MSPCNRFAYLSSLSRLWVVARAATSILSHSGLLADDDPRRRASRAALMRSMTVLASAMRRELGSDPELTASLLATVDRLHQHCTGYGPELCPEREELDEYLRCAAAQASLLYALARDHATDVADAAHAMSEACSQAADILHLDQRQSALEARSA